MEWKNGATKAGFQRKPSASHKIKAVSYTHLLDNGIKFSPEFGKLSVSLHTKDGTCIVKVQDHGPGMDQATSDLIFTKFYQGDTSHQSEGNGLGLALVKKIIELHRGTVTVESNTGKGSTFIVVLPL